MPDQTPPGNYGEGGDEPRPAFPWESTPTPPPPNPTLRLPEPPVAGVWPSPPPTGAWPQAIPEPKQGFGRKTWLLIGAAVVSCIAVVAAATIFVVTRSTTGVPTAAPESAPAATTTPTAVVPKPGMDFDDFRLTVTGAGSDRLTVAEAAAPAVAMPAFVTDQRGAVSLTLPGGVQPASPLTLDFSFDGKTPPVLGKNLVPAVVTVAEGSSVPEVLSSTWDAATQTLTAKADHLSTFFPAILDFNVLTGQFGDAINGFLGLQSERPGCVGQPLTVGGTTYTLDPEIVPAAWPCLSTAGDEISVDLASNSPNAWLVRSDPTTADMGVDVVPDFGYAVNQTAYHTIFAGVIGDGTILLPGSTTHLRFDAQAPPTLIGLRADPGAMLLNGLLVGLHALYPDAKLLEIPGAVDCFKQFPPDLSATPSTTDIGADVRSLTNCITSVGNLLSTKSAGGLLADIGTVAAKSLGAVLSLGPDIATQLAASLSGLFGEINGSNTQSITVRATKDEQPEQPVPSDDHTLVPLVLKTHGSPGDSGEEVGPNHFQMGHILKDDGKFYVSLKLRWETADKKGVAGYCNESSKVIDSGGGVVVERTQQLAVCDYGGNWSFNITTPGTYTYALEVTDRDNGTVFRGEQQFTVDP